MSFKRDFSKSKNKFGIVSNVQMNILLTVLQIMSSAANYKAYVQVKKAIAKTRQTTKCAHSFLRKLWKTERK
jgi:hypothetical protein